MEKLIALRKQKLGTSNEESVQPAQEISKRLKRLRNEEEESRLIKKTTNKREYCKFRTCS